MAISPEGGWRGCHEPTSWDWSRAGTPITVGSSPSGIAILPDGTTAYVANFGSNTVTPIDIATHTAGAPIAVTPRPLFVAITPDGRTVYVVSDNDNENLTPIDTATNSAGTSITVGLAPGGVAITPDQAPKAQLSVTPGQPGTTTTFHATASVAYGTVATYKWTFGDGATATTTTANATHVYSAAGSYTATVTETTTGGTSTTRVFTGQTMSRNGGAAARSSAVFAVTTGLTIPSTGAGWLLPGGTLTLLVGVTLLSLGISRRRDG
jgi:YVTN family beta-propeller protein